MKIILFNPFAKPLRFNLHSHERLFYDGYRNLVARGVIAPASAAPSPRPFPRFAADPA
jgi:hypothetical protein